MFQAKKACPNMILSDAQIMEASRLFSILAEPVRLKLLRSLMEENLTVTELVETTGCKQANVSKHLSLMLSSGLVERTKEGTSARYSITDPFLKQLCTMVCGRTEAVAKNKLRSLASVP
jgi:DNA-binding transcriptional ArsR family regulator